MPPYSNPLPKNIHTGGAFLVQRVSVAILGAEGKVETLYIYIYIYINSYYYLDGSQVIVESFPFQALKTLLPGTLNYSPTSVLCTSHALLSEQETVRRL